MLYLLETKWFQTRRSRIPKSSVVTRTHLYHRGEVWWPPCDLPPKGGEGRQVEAKVPLGPQVGIQLYAMQGNQRIPVRIFPACHTTFPASCFLKSFRKPNIYSQMKTGSLKVPKLGSTQDEREPLWSLKETGSVALSQSFVSSQQGPGLFGSHSCVAPRRHKNNTWSPSCWRMPMWLKEFSSPKQSMASH